MTKKNDTAHTGTSSRLVPRRRTREGWAEAFGDVEELDCEDFAWLDFANEEDAEIVWRTEGRA
jgi:hypothetical protein